MSPSAAIVLYVLAVLVAGAFAAYPTALALEALGLDVEFRSVLSRTLKLLALLGLFPLLRTLGMSSLRHWGLALPPGRFVKQALVGVAAGAAMLGVLVAGLLLLGVRVDHEKVSLGAVDFVWLAVQALAAGLVIGFVEEAWFRGALHSVVGRAAGAAAAVLITASLYSWVHFLKAKSALEPDTLHWLSGFELLSKVLLRFAYPEAVDSALALLAAGVLLGLIRHRTGAIAYCVGVHAGWVMVIKLVKEVTRLDKQSSYGWLAGDYDSVIGYLAAAWLLTLGFAYYWFYVRRPAKTRDG